MIRTSLPIGATGADALKQVWAMLLQVYPDIHLKGEFMGVAATGKPVTYNQIFIFRFAAGPSR